MAPNPLHNVRSGKTHILNYLFSSQLICATRSSKHITKCLEVSVLILCRNSTLDCLKILCICNSCIMGLSDLPDMYTHTLGPAALGLGCTYQRSKARDTTDCTMQANSLLRASKNPSQHEVNYWIYYIGSSVEFDHGSRIVC